MAVCAVHTASRCVEQGPHLHPAPTTHYPHYRNRHITLAPTHKPKSFGLMSPLFNINIMAGPLSEVISTRLMTMSLPFFTY